VASCSTDTHVVENETWIPLTLSGSIPAPRNACSATVINNKIFIFGGSVSWNSKEGFSDVNVLELGKEQLFTKPKVIGESPCGSSQTHVGQLVRALF
jgi:hypothetical protein